MLHSGEQMELFGNVHLECSSLILCASAYVWMISRKRTGCNFVHQTLDARPRSFKLSTGKVFTEEVGFFDCSI